MLDRQSASAGTDDQPDVAPPPQRAPPLTVPVRPDPDTEGDKPGGAPAGAPPLSIPIPPDPPTEPSVPGRSEPPLSVPSR